MSDSSFQPPIPRLIFIIFMIFVIGSANSCTPFKLSSYQECEFNTDCLEGFEICNESYLCQVEGALCRWSTQYGDSFLSHYDPKGIVLGVLADEQDFNIGGSQHSAYLGVHAGLRLVSSALQLPEGALLICDADLRSRDEVLKTFRRYDVQTIIGEPRLTDLDGGESTSNNEAYISIGLQPIKVNSAPLGWLNLSPDREDLERAFESLSSELLDYQITQNNPLNMMIPVQQTPLQPDFIQDLIWRLSPYDNSIFRTLVVYYDPYISIDNNIIKFLSEPRPLRMLVSYESLDREQLKDITQTAIEKSNVSSAQGPLWIYSALWEVTQPLTETQGYWSDILQIGLSYGPDFTKTMSTELSQLEVNTHEQLERDIFEVATLLGAPSPKGSPYFSLAYDAAVVSTLVSLGAKGGEAPRSLLDKLSVTESTDELIELSAEGLAKVVNTADGQLQIVHDHRRLFGLSGTIRHRSEGDTQPIFMSCSKNGLLPLINPVQKLNSADYRELGNGITQRFEIESTVFEQCVSE